MSPQRPALSNFPDRAREKSEMRVRDSHALASGSASKEQLKQSNGFFSKLDMKSVRVVGRVSMGQR